MSTNATIGYQKGDKVYYVYCHWDGCVSGVGKLLYKYYNTIDKVKALVALGDISSLDKTIDCPPGHSFDTRLPGCTTFYGRDSGETEQECRVVSLLEYNKGYYDSQKYNYLFVDNEWFVACDEGIQSLASFFNVIV